MKLTFTKKPSKDSIYILPVFQKEKVKNPALGRILKKLAAAKEFEAKKNQTFLLYGAIKSLPNHVLLLGMGNAKKLKVADTMAAFGSAIKAAKKFTPKKIAIEFTPALYDFAEAIAETITLADYQPHKAYKTGKELKKLTEKSTLELEILSTKMDTQTNTAFKKGAMIAAAANEARDWVNAPPNYAGIKFFQELAAKIAKESKSKLTILHNKDIEKLGMGGLLAVNRGSPEEAIVAIFDFTPKGASEEKPLVFVGKGIIFDSGGYNLKPRGYIEDMQSDKAGAAAVFALAKILPLLNLKRRVICIAPFAENLIGSKALKPSEIIKMHNGKTVEITNTDGEGRLILADAISYAIEKYKPEFVIDIATLTGACVVALGDRYAGLFGNNKNLMDSLIAAGKETDELLWQLPLHKEHSEKMKGEYADLRNADLGSEKHAGASKGAAFLKAFVGKTPWVHIDIAAPAFTEDPKKYEHKGATGFGVRLLSKFLEKYGEVS